MVDTDKDFTLDLLLKAAPAVIYAAVATRSGIASWWTTHTDYDDRTGSIAHMRFPGNGFYACMKVIAREPNSLVRWHCVDAGHPPQTGLSDLKDWTRTEVSFEIRPVSDNESRLVFTHAGLAPLECHDMCSRIWTFYIGTSLKSLVETGTGQPHQ
jgi:uncharacterized protein YndB with AHSA1/START domain